MKDTDNAHPGLALAREALRAAAQSLTTLSTPSRYRDIIDVYDYASNRAGAAWAALEATTTQPGDPIVKCSCPCCGASLDITHGDDGDETSVIGTPLERPAEEIALPTLRPRISPY